MARRTVPVTITDADSRDKGKVFRITEMAADRAERWAWRFSLALLRAGADVPEGTLDAGLAGIKELVPRLLVYGLKSMSGLRYEDVEPLLAEMYECVEYRAPGTDSFFALASPSGMSQVEEVATLLRLRWEVVQLHVNFSMADALSNLRARQAAPPSA